MATTLDKNTPAGWARLSLGQVCTLGSNRVTPAEVSNVPYIGLEHIERDVHRLKGHGHASDTTSTKSIFRAGDILYGRLRPNLNKVLIAPFDGVCSTDILVLQPGPLLDSRFLLDILSTAEFLAYAESRTKGINLPRLSADAVIAYIAPIPPLKEQLRIIEALDKYRALQQAVRDRLSGIQQLLASMPAQILAAATHGRLTETWRVEHAVDRHTSDEPGSLFADGSGKLPAGWISKTVGEAGSVRLGRARTPEHHQGPNLRPYLRVANVLEARIDVSDVMEMNFTDEEFEKFRLSNGDILLNEGQSLELVGRPAIFRDELPSVCFTNSLIQFRCHDDVVPEFAILIFRHYLHSGVFSSIAKITTNLAHLGASRLAGLPFPIPPFDEQLEIAAIGQAHLNHTERLGQRISRLSSLVEAFDASLRSEALMGRLVDQDGKDQRVEAALKEVELLAAAVEKPAKITRRTGITMKKIVPVLDAIREASSPLSGQQLFSAAGYPEDATSDLVEKFYLELRQQIVEGNIERREEDGVDIFALSGGQSK